MQFLLQNKDSSGVQSKNDAEKKILIRFMSIFCVKSCANITSNRKKLRKDKFELIEGFLLVIKFILNY